MVSDVALSYGIAEWDKLFPSMQGLVECAAAHIPHGGVHGAVHGFVWNRVGSERGDIDWDFWQNVPKNAPGDIAHAIGHGLLFKHQGIEMGVKGMPFCPCCKTPVIHSPSATRAALRECAQADDLVMRSWCADGLYHGTFDNTDYLYKDENPFMACNGLLTGHCFNQFFNVGFFTNTTSRGIAYSRPYVEMTFMRLAKHSGHLTSLCLPEHPYMHVSERTPQQMSQACIWGMTAKLFPIFHLMMKVYGFVEECQVCGLVLSANDLFTPYNKFLCPLLLDGMTPDMYGAQHSHLYTWCNLFASSAQTFEGKESRWIACLHGAFHWLPPSMHDETPCDRDIHNVSERVGRVCELWRQPGRPFAHESYGIAISVDVM
eukprot:99856-Prymnesium_polylepis.1